jgi:hypothetical protein
MCPEFLLGVEFEIARVTLKWSLGACLRIGGNGGESVELEVWRGHVFSDRIMRSKL